jgi:hypothetical protein
MAGTESKDARTIMSIKHARVLLSFLVSVSLSAALAAADTKSATVNLTAAQIVDKHVTARGGLQAWHAVQTLSVTGKIEAGSGDSAARSARLAREGMGASIKHAGSATPAASDKAAENQEVQLPFRLEMKRPHKSRLEIDFAGKTAVQIFDGQNGWKLRPYLNRNDVEPFTTDEAKSEAVKADLEGPLLDYATKATRVSLDGVEPVDGHDAYKLKLAMKNGDIQHIWIDAQSFLDVKMDGIPRRMDNKMRNVWIYQRDFRPVQGLMVPFVYETAIDGNPRTHRMTVDTVAVNRTLDEQRFAKPQAAAAGAAAPPVAASLASGIRTQANAK